MDFCTLQKNAFLEKRILYEKNIKHTFESYLYELPVSEKITKIYKLGYKW